MLERVGREEFESILVDTAVLNLPATAFSLLANHRIEEQSGLPVGCAPSNGGYMWKQSLDLWGRPGFAAVDASVDAVSAPRSDFRFFGPMTGIGRVFPAVAGATALLSTLACAEVRSLPAVGNHSLYLLFPEVPEQLLQEVRED